MINSKNTIATLIYPVRDNKIWLGLKQKKVAAGLRSGYGGKQHSEDKTVLDTACRELDEENNNGISYQREDLDLRAVIDFTLNYSNTESFAMRVFIYVLLGFSGELGETSEINDPKPYAFNNIPFDNMLDDNKEFLEKILNGQYLFGSLNSLDGKLIKEKSILNTTTAEHLSKMFLQK